MSEHRTASGKHHQLVTLLMTIVIPAVILLRLSTPDRLGPGWGLVAALAFPVGWGMWEFRDRHQVTVYSVLGFVGILLTGGIGLLELHPQWIAVKEAAVPLTIAILILLSTRTRWNMGERLLGQVLDVEKITRLVHEKGEEATYRQALRRAQYLLAVSFLVSAVLNFGLARVVVRSDPGTTAFNEELGRLTLLSYPVIVVPSMLVMAGAVWYLLRCLKAVTGVSVSELIHQP